MALKKISGVTSIKSGKHVYWYASLEGRKTYIGKGDEGYERAVAAKSKETARKYELKHSDINLDVKKSAFKTLSDLLDWYIEQPSIMALKSYPQKKVAVKHLKSYFRNRPLKNIAVDDQEMYRQHHFNNGKSHGYLNNHASVLSASYHLAAKRKLISTDLVPGEFIKVEVADPRRIIKDAEYEALLKAADPDYRDVLVCGYETGMRSREIRRLTRSQVHLDIKHFSGKELNYISLGVFDVKNRTERVIPISPVLKPIIKRRIKGLAADDRVCTYHGEPYGSDSIKNFMKSTCKRAGVTYGDKARNLKGYRTGLVFHSLRHSAITRWIRRGYSDEIIRRISGHKDLSSYRKYVHLEAVDLMDVVQNRIQPYTNSHEPAKTEAL